MDPHYIYFLGPDFDPASGRGSGSSSFKKTIPKAKIYYVEQVFREKINREFFFSCKFEKMDRWKYWKYELPYIIKSVNKSVQLETQLGTVPIRYNLMKFS